MDEHCAVVMVIEVASVINLAQGVRAPSKFVLSLNTLVIGMVIVDKSCFLVDKSEYIASCDQNHAS